MNHITVRRKYLSPYLNILKMYREYCLVCKFKKKKILSTCMFRHIFNTRFNLSFHSLVVDSCELCDSINAALKSNQSEEQNVIFREKK